MVNDDGVEFQQVCKSVSIFWRTVPPGLDFSIDSGVEPCLNIIKAVKGESRIIVVRFPSSEFFNALKDQMTAEQARFRRLGFIDTTFGISVSHNGAARNFVLAFEIFELKDVHEVAQLDLAQLDFAIEGDLAVWREMIEDIKRHGEADTTHDLNTLAHFGEALKISYADPEGHDKLYRFMESIQEFFDLSSRVDVTF